MLNENMKRHFLLLSKSVKLYHENIFFCLRHHSVDDLSLFHDQYLMVFLWYLMPGCHMHHPCTTVLRSYISFRSVMLSPIFISKFCFKTFIFLNYVYKKCGNLEFPLCGVFGAISEMQYLHSLWKIKLFSFNSFQFNELYFVYFSKQLCNIIIHFLTIKHNFDNLFWKICCFL